MNTSRDEEQPPTNGDASEDNEKKPEQSLEIKPGGGVNVLDLASSSPPSDDFNPGWRFYASFTSLCIITLAVALDATTLSVALPVTNPLPFPSFKSHLTRSFIFSDLILYPRRKRTTGLVRREGRTELD